MCNYRVHKKYIVVKRYLDDIMYFLCINDLQIDGIDLLSAVSTNFTDCCRRAEFPKTDDYENYNKRGDGA
jgi:hypothetical protein